MNLEPKWLLLILPLIFLKPLLEMLMSLNNSFWQVIRDLISVFEANAFLTIGIILLAVLLARKT